MEALNNKDDSKSIYKEIFDKIVKEKFDEIKWLGDEIDHNDQYIILRIIITEILIILIIL